MQKVFTAHLFTIGRSNFCIVCRPNVGRQHPHQSEKVLCGTFSDSFSLEGEAFGEHSHLLRQNEQRWIKDKASPHGEKLRLSRNPKPPL